MADHHAFEYARAGNTAGLRALLLNGADDVEADANDRRGRTLVFYAAKYGHTETATSTVPYSFAALSA
jgi:ankyrin repeat protein